MDDRSSTPKDSPLSPLEVAAVILHERFEAFMRAGFTEAQALHLVSLSVVPTAAREGDAL